MKLIIGLGNPEEKYKNTRHNVGFMALDNFLEAWNLKRGTNNKFKLDKKSNSEIAELAPSPSPPRLAESKRVPPGEREKKAQEKIILAKPQTFMNNSGSAVKSLVSRFKIQDSSLLIIHDEIDLPFGEVRVSHGASSAGHKGVQSVINALDTKEFTRIRIGVNNPETRRDEKTEEYILKKFSKEEIKKLEEVLPQAVTKMKEKIS